MGKIEEDACLFSSDDDPPGAGNNLLLNTENVTVVSTADDNNFIEPSKYQSSNDTLFSSTQNISPIFCEKTLETWQQESRLILKNVADLSAASLITDAEKINLRQTVKKYHMRIPHYYFSLINDLSDRNDPIRRQCIPSELEMQDNFDMMTDPLDEENTSPVSSLVHRYPDRALLIVTGRCFMYCRHCTRKRLWNEKIHEPSLKDIEKAIQYIKDNRSIREVIISGGDPLTLSTEKLSRILKAVASASNIQVMRIGTRAPVVFPQRIDDKLCSVLKNYRNLWINVQFNHPCEITSQSIAACEKLRQCGLPISNQSVLLKGINDSPEIMRELCQELQSIGVRPYYLFQCDPVVGASHFRTSVWKGVEIIEKMRGHTSGMCVPVFVVDGIEGKGKIPIGPNYVQSIRNGAVQLRNYNNEKFWYLSPDDNTESIDSNKTKVSTIAIVFNLKSGKKNGDAEEEYDEIETIEVLKREIENFGFEVRLIEQTPDFATVIRSQKIDFVLNLAEGIGGGRNRESEVPSVLESLGIPYSGSDPLSLNITLDKYRTNQILKSSGVPVPEQYLIFRKEEIGDVRGIFDGKRRFIVKPRWEGSSKGIFLNSVVDNFNDLKKMSLMLFDRYSQPVIVEEFLENEEITAGVSGNRNCLCLLGMIKISPKEGIQKQFVYSIENKRDWQKKIRYEGIDAISTELQVKVHDYALEAFLALELRDIARIDFRVDSEGIPKIIDVNPLPGLSPLYSDLPILYSLNGGNYTDLIKIILQQSFKRCGFTWAQPNMRKEK